jgi:PDZ domain-containing secreted protein
VLRGLHPLTALPLDIVRSYATKKNMDIHYNYSGVISLQISDVLATNELTTSDDNISVVGAVSTVSTRVLETASHTVLGFATTVQSRIICRKPSCWSAINIMIGQC